MAVKKEAVKETAEKAVEAVKTEAEAVKDTAKKTVKKAAAKTGAAAKKATTAAKKTADTAKKTVKKAADAKKAVAKKDVVQLQFGGKDLAVEDIVAAVKADFKANNKGAIKSVEVYLKPEDNAAYYVVNGVAGKVEL